MISTLDQRIEKTSTGSLVLIFSSTSRTVHLIFGRTSCTQVLCKKDVLTNFHSKIPELEPLINKVEGLQQGDSFCS